TAAAARTRTRRSPPQVLVDPVQVRAGAAAPVLVDLRIDARVGRPQREVAAGSREREVAESEPLGPPRRHVVREAELAEPQEFAVFVLIHAVVGSERLEV